jgi:hypothetical protein
MSGGRPWPVALPAALRPAPDDRASRAPEDRQISEESRVMRVKGARRGRLARFQTRRARRCPEPFRGRGYRSGTETRFRHRGPVGRPNSHHLADHIDASSTPARAVEEAGLVTVVSAAAKLDVVDRRLAAGAVRVQVVEFDEPPRPTTVSVRCDEGAASAVTHPDAPLHLSRDVPGVVLLATALPRVCGRRELPAGEVLDKRAKRSSEHLRQVPARDRVAPFQRARFGG